MKKTRPIVQCGALGETRAYNERKYQFRVHDASPVSVRAAVRQTWIGAKCRVRGA